TALADDGQLLFGRPVGWNRELYHLPRVAVALGDNALRVHDSTFSLSGSNSQPRTVAIRSHRSTKDRQSSCKIGSFVWRLVQCARAAARPIKWWQPARISTA